MPHAPLTPHDARRPRRPARRPMAIAAGTLALVVAAGAAWWALRSSEAPRAGAAGPPASAAQAPVIIYLIDTLRADRLPAYGYPRPTAPVLSALASESVVFDDAVAPSPWTVPSVASLVTSTYACEHGVVNARLQLNAGIVTLAQRLRGVGYATGAYYENLYAGPALGLDRGYEVSEFRDQRGLQARDAERFLDGRAGSPFLLYIHTMEPHQTYLTDYRFTRPFGHVPVESKARIEADWNRYTELRSQDFTAGRPPGTTDSTAEQTALLARFTAVRDQFGTLYDGAVLSADEALGKVIATLKNEGVWDRALFILIADHGEEFGEHGSWFHEDSVYQELLHVPLLIRFPGGEFAGRRVSRPVSLVDVAPTILDFLGKPALCGGCRGTSLMPSVRGEPGAAGGAPVAALRINTTNFYRPLHVTHGDVNVVVRRDSWKAIWNVEPDSLELYDLRTDTREERNLAPAQPALAQEMRASASDWFRGCAARALAPSEIRLDYRTREKLRALGYAQ